MEKDIMNNIIVLNIQGLLRHYEEIVHLIIEEKPSICCLTETHIGSEVESREIEIPG